MKDINIVKIINSEFAVSPEDGDTIYELIVESINLNEKVYLNFSGIDIMTTAFLNNAIGKLYKTFNKEVLNKFITMQNISDSDLALVKKVIERAKITFSEDDVKSLEKELEDEQ